ncbi:MAG: hypothetical protein JWM80_1483 [Cyanobacteria bacterium RYN_339]|nr:hypothetical protein [Cyanobacteria bacterium RYN_339]
MPWLPFALVLGLLVFANLAYPLWQAISTGGLVYYTNANDEATYLQYDFAQVAASPTRPGQYLVVWAHQLGLSGGWQNLLADAVVPIAFALATGWLLRRMGWEPSRARLAALAMLVVPMLVGTQNPLFRSLSFRNIATGWIYWINMVDQRACGLLRTPEPQASWVILMVAAIVALRLRSIWPLLAATLVSYTFVGMPTAFVAAAWELHRRWGDRPGRRWAPLLVTWLAIGAASGLYFHLVASERLRFYLIPSHLPLLSLTSVLALALYAALRKDIASEWRFPALAVALAPLAVSNQQIISGFVAQPSNFEQHFGVVAIAFVLVLGARAWPRVYPALVACGCALWLATASIDFRMNVATNSPLPFDGKLTGALREDSRHVAVNDRDLASVLGLVYPRQPATALGYDQGSPAVAARYIADYRCARRQILADYPHDVGFFKATVQLDYLFTTGNIWLPIVSLGRPLPPPTLYNVEAGCEPGVAHPLRYFLVKGP